MNKTAFWSSAFGVLFGAAVALAATRWLSSAPQSSSLADEPSTDESEQLPRTEPPPSEEELDQLYRRVASLERRLSLIAQTMARLTGQDVKGAADGAGVAAPALDNVDVADPVFEAAVLDVLERAEETREQEREQRRQEFRRMRVEQRAQHLEKRLDLTPDQSERVEAIIDARFSKIRGLRRGENPPTSRTEWIQRVDQLTTEAEAELARTLSPQQLERYQALDEEEKLGGWGPRRRETR